MKPAIAMICLLMGLFLEAAMWDETMSQSPDELTVTDFELAEEGFSVVLTNALEDARALVDHLTIKHDNVQRTWMKAKADGQGKAAAYCGLGVMQAAEIQFRAMRVLGLLEAVKEREAGRLA